MLDNRKMELANELKAGSLIQGEADDDSGSGGADVKFNSSRPAHVSDNSLADSILSLAVTKMPPKMIEDIMRPKMKDIIKDGWLLDKFPQLLKDERAPSKPENLSAVTGVDTITLSWEPPVYTGVAREIPNLVIDQYGRVHDKGTHTINDWITDYKISEGGNAWLSVGLAQTHTFEHLALGRMYKYSVIAVNCTGYESPPASISAVLIGYPSEPQNLSVSFEANLATFTWAPPASDGGAEIIYYLVSINGEDPLNVGITTSLTFKWNQPGQTYNLAVWAVNRAGAGPAAKLTVKTPEA